MTFTPGFFSLFFYFASKWIPPILEFRKKILEFKTNFLEFREKILSLGRKIWNKMSVFTYFFLKIVGFLSLAIEFA